MNLIAQFLPAGTPQLNIICLDGGIVDVVGSMPHADAAAQIVGFYDFSVIPPDLASARIFSVTVVSPQGSVGYACGFVGDKFEHGGEAVLTTRALAFFDAVTQAANSAPKALAWGKQIAEAKR